MILRGFMQPPMSPDAASSTKKRSPSKTSSRKSSSKSLDDEGSDEEDNTDVSALAALPDESDEDGRTKKRKAPSKRKSLSSGESMQETNFETTLNAGDEDLPPATLFDTELSRSGRSDQMDESNDSMENDEYEMQDYADDEDMMDSDNARVHAEDLQLASNQVLLTLSYSLVSQVKQVARMEGVNPEDILIELVAEGLTRRAFLDAQRPQPNHLATRTGYIPPEANGPIPQPQLSHHGQYQQNGNTNNNSRYQQNNPNWRFQAGKNNGPQNSNGRFNGRNNQQNGQGGRPNNGFRNNNSGPFQRNNNQHQGHPPRQSGLQSVNNGQNGAPANNNHQNNNNNSNGNGNGNTFSGNGSNNSKDPKRS